jgi:cytochrome oxidase Cu insertion factor (SCO1/SenC/PrrC family)
MKPYLLLLPLAGVLADSRVDSAELIETSPGIVTADLLKRRSAEYDYEVPPPGSYELPVLQPAADGWVLGTNGARVALHDLCRGRVVVLSFIYTRCADPKACMRATGVLSELQRISRQHPTLAERLLLLTLSFDPAHDTPGVMSWYGRVSLGHGQGADWLFLTTRNQAELQPLLEAYGQRVDRRKNFSVFGPYYHPLRVYLIDPQQQVRNIYSYGLLDPRLVATDAQTLLLEDAARRTGTGIRLSAPAGPPPRVGG